MVLGCRRLGYNHIVPGQACYPRQYDTHLAERIASDLELEEEDKVAVVDVGPKAAHAQVNSCEMRINLSSQLATQQTNLQNDFFRHQNAQYLEAVRVSLSQVVLKLCNRSRAAGVIVVPLDELDEVLEEILMPPPLLRSIQESKVRKVP